jgi:hypothetical protein
MSTSRLMLLSTTLKGTGLDVPYVPHDLLDVEAVDPLVLPGASADGEPGADVLECLLYALAKAPREYAGLLRLVACVLSGLG